MAELEFDNVTKRFGRDVLAVKNLSLTVHDEEFLVLLGPSGCGKTTAMRMVAGLEEVTQGRILLDGKDVTDLPPRKRNVSMIFQNYAVWPHMTVYDNIAFALKLKKMHKDKIESIVRDVAAMTNIGELLERYPSQLSGGQQQRVAVARAIAVSPKVFLMDEPLSNLDAKLRGSMRTELKAIHTKTEATTVFVTHDQSEAMSMADRIVVMRDGEIVQIGSPEDVYNNSASVFVAGFIGTPPTNFLDVELHKENGDYVLINPHFTMKLNRQRANTLVESGTKHLILGVRPEDIVLSDSEEGSTFSTECLVTEPQGSHQIVAVELDHMIMKIVAPTTPRVRAGQEIHIVFDPEAIHYFDKESGLRV
ncbi:MAG: ABC transporter ATP-binding protein [Candidatus Promineifilaceae bacterium]|jgi:multiple sugar transport system ATP-binding protein